MKFRQPSNFSNNSKESDQLSLSIKFPLNPHGTNVHLSFRQQGNRKEQSRKQSIKKLPKSNDKKIEKPIVQSANVSREKIQLDEDNLCKNIQFNKQNKNRLKIMHKRTKSNHIELGIIKDQMSNFSNSLQNISQQIIQIPFANTIIKPKIPPLAKITNTQEQLKRVVSFHGNTKNSLQKKINQSNKRIQFKRKSIEKTAVKQANQFKPIIKIKSCDKIINIPKPRPKTKFLASLNQFSLKAIKITDGGSIVYLAMHKQTNAIFGIKSIKKKIIKPHIESFLLQLKLSILITHPNIAKVYGIFHDKDNFYIVKEYMEEGSIIQKKRFTEGDVACQINQILYAILYILPLTNGDNWLLEPKNVSQTQGICKITTIKIRRIDESGIFSDKIKSFLLYLLQTHRRTQNPKDIFETNESIHFNMIKNGSYFLGTFKQMVQSFLNIRCNQILMLWDTQFLKQYRFRSLMLQQS